MRHMLMVGDVIFFQWAVGCEKSMVRGIDQVLGEVEYRRESNFHYHFDYVRHTAWSIAKRNKESLAYSKIKQFIPRFLC